MNIRVWFGWSLAAAFLAVAAPSGRELLSGGKSASATAGWRGQPATEKVSSGRGAAADGTKIRPPAGCIGPVEARLLAASAAALDEPGSAAADASLRAAISSLLDLGQVAAAQRLLEQTPPGPARDNLLGIFTFAWAARDPEAALAWASQRPDENERSLTLARVCSALGDDDPPGALALTGRLRFHGREQVRESIVGRWALQEPSVAREWVLRQPDGEQRDRFVSRIAAIDARHFPADAAAFALDHLPPGGALDETIIAIVHEWAARDAAGAAGWVQTFPEGAFRERAAREVAGMMKYLQ